MPTWTLRILRVRLSLSVAALLATVAHGAEREALPIPLHPLVRAAEVLYQRNLPQACGELIGQAQAFMSHGATNDDRSRLQFLNALRAIDDGDEDSARSVVSYVLRTNPSATLPSFASKLGELVKEARASLLEAADEDRSDLLAADRKAVSEREPESIVLLQAVDLLYAVRQFAGAAVVLDLVPTSEAPVRAQVALRRGILRIEAGDEPGARAAFNEALEADRSTSLPTRVSPKSLQAFEDVQRASGAASNPFLEGQRGWGVAVGGAGLALIAGGAMSGFVALNSYHMEQRALKSLDYDAYTQNRDASKVAINVADGLYIAGAAALGVGTYLFLSAPGKASVGVVTGSGRASVVVGGYFQ